MEKHLHPVRSNQTSSSQTAKDDAAKKARPLLLRVFAITLVMLFFTVSAFSQNCSVNAGIDATICPNEPLWLYGNNSGAFPPGGDDDILWEQVGGPTVTILNPTSFNTQVTNFQGGYTYTFRISTTCEDGSYAYQDVNKTVLFVTTANAGPDATYCPLPGPYSLAANAASGLNETGFWQGGGAGVSISNTSSPTSPLVISGNSSGSVSLVWTIRNTVSGCSSRDTVIITNRGGASVLAGEDQNLSHCYSFNQSTNLAGSYGGSNINGQIGVWTVISGPNVPTITNPNSNTTGVSGLIEGTYTFRWTVSGPCAFGFDDVQINVPAPTADLTGASISGGGSQIFCDGRTSTVLQGSIPQYINETVLWTFVSGPTTPTIVSSTSPITSVTGLNGSGTYTFRYTINNNVTNCSGSATVTVSYVAAPVINITPEQVFLECEETVATIPYTASGGTGTTEYRLLSGTTTILSIVPPDTNYVTFPTNWTSSGASPVTIAGLNGIGTYIIQMRRTAPEGVSCSSAIDQVYVITSFEGSPSNAGTDQILNCNIISTTLSGNEPLVGEGTWSLVSGPGSASTLGDIHDHDLNIFGLVPGLYTFRWLISGGPLCDPNWDDVTVLVANEIPLLAVAGDDITVCSQAVTRLDADPPEYIFERGYWQEVPLNANIVFADSTLYNTTVTGFTLANSPYTLRWTVRNGCGSKFDDIIVTVDPSLSPVVANAVPGQCLGTGITEVTLGGNNPSPYAGNWNLLSGATNVPLIVDPTLYNTEVTGMTDGTYRFEWVVDCGCICGVTRDTVLITIDNPVTVADAGPDITLCGECNYHGC